MNSIVTVRKCREYELHEIYNLISEIYEICQGPEVGGKKVLVKPNILTDSDPAKAIITHPVVVEAMIRFLQSKGAVVLVGDSPAIHTRVFKGEKSGIYQVCQKTGATWVDFTKKHAEIKSGKSRIKFPRKFERRPVFNHRNCTGCLECIEICPEKAIIMHHDKPNYVLLTDNKCSRCFCCSEVCQSNAIDIRRKSFGV
ncbi:MAG: DUF362 domain-containing protein [Bacteroidales bacterium]|jgi:ferredoxin|nr:DUF362 domain-containing protein [Bacteroidales bacterium]